MAGQDLIRALDTNVLVRLLTWDDPAQAAAAQEIADEGFILTATVMMETEWVLRSRYGWSRDQRASALRLLLDMPGAIDVPTLADWAIERMAAGADFADMMHLTSAVAASSFATFDRNMAKEAGNTAPISIETLA